MKERHLLIDVTVWSLDPKIDIGGDGDSTNSDNSLLRNNMLASCLVL